jgi:hypothetical protein
MNDDRWFNEEYRGKKLRDVDLGNLDEYRANGLIIRTNSHRYCEDSVFETLQYLPPYLYECTVEEAFWYFDRLYITLNAA